MEKSRQTNKDRETRKETNAHVSRETKRCSNNQTNEDEQEHVNRYKQANKRNTIKLTNTTYKQNKQANKQTVQTSKQTNSTNQ